jgi:leucyl aminopeptidase
MHAIYFVKNFNILCPESAMPENRATFFFSNFSEVGFKKDTTVLAYLFEDQEDAAITSNFPEFEARRQRISAIPRRGEELFGMQAIVREGEVYNAGIVYIQYPWKKRRVMDVGGVNFLREVYSQTTFATRRLRDEGTTKLVIVLPARFSTQGVKDKVQRQQLYSFVRTVTEAIIYANNNYDKFLNDKTKPIQEVTFVFFGEHQPALDGFFKKAIGDGEIIGHGLVLARNLIETPPNLKSPLEFASAIIGKEISVEDAQGWKKFVISPQTTVSVLFGNAALKDQGFELISAVGVGSENEPLMLKVHYKPATNRKKKIKKIAITAKGVVYDTGGYDMKGTGYYDNMHYDMGGAATAFAVIRLAEQFNLPVELTAVIPVVQSMVSPKTVFLPGSIIRAYGGKTVEIINTDCEGRLLMGEAIAYAEKKLNPDVFVTIGTLGDIKDFGPDFLKTAYVGDSMEKKLRIAEKLSAEKMIVMPTMEHLNQVDRSHASLRADLVNDVYACYHTSPFVFMYNFFTYEPTWAFVDISSIFESYAQDYGAGPGFGVKFVWHLIQQFA